METKKCTKCKEFKFINEFNNNSGLKSGKNSSCKKCVSEFGKIYREKYKDFLNKKASKWRSLNPEKVKKQRRLYHARNKEEQCAKHREYYKKNRKKLSLSANLYVSKRRKIDPLYKLKRALRGRMFYIFKLKNLKKDKMSEETLGASFETVKKHIERQFKKGMTWKNHGKGEGKWHIDHKIPVGSAKTKEDANMLFHYTNLQPLWGIDNLKKQDNIIPTQMTMTI